MLRGELEVLVGVVLFLVGAVLGAQTGSMLFPGTVALGIIGILCILTAVFDTST